MQVLTPSGYVDIIDLNIGDEVIAYDINTGEQIINHLEGKTLWTPDMFPAEYTVGRYDEDGNYIEPELVYTSYEVFQRIQGNWKFYRINDTWDLYKDQSVWANMNVVHASDLQIGDVIYNDSDGDIIITSIEEIDTPLSWWKLDVSGDSSYIADGLTLHNASRYWVGGGSSSNWNATGNTNWGSTSGGANNASVPTSADIAFFDGLGNSSSVISAGITILSLIIANDYTSTMTHNALLQIGGNLTFGANYTIAGTSGIQINTTATITSNGKTWPNNFTLSVAPGTFTLVGDLTINGTFNVGAYNGAPAAVINKTTTEKVILNGPIAASLGNGPNYVNGTANIDMYGSSWSGVQFGAPFTNYGTVALTGTNLGAYGGFTNLGTINAGTSTFNGNGPNFNSGGAVFNNFNTGYGTLVLTSDLTINGTFVNNGNQAVNKTTNEVVYVYGSLTQTTSNQTFGGNATVILKSGIWTAGVLSNAPFAMPITIDGNISIGGNVLHSGTLLTYVSGVITPITTATLTFGNVTQTFTFNAGANMQVPMILSGGTKTLLGNFSTSGLITVSSGTTINRTTTETFSCGGGLAVNSTLAGTATISLTGGTWSGTNTTGISSPLNINGAITISGNVYYGTGTISYTSGTITGGTLNIVSNCTLNTSTLVWNNIAFIANSTTTLTSNLIIGGLWSTGTVQVSPIINSTTSETVTCAGGITFGNNCIPTGTAKHIATGGTVTCTAGYGAFALPLDFQGNVTLSSFFTQGKPINYVSGTVTVVSGSFFGVGGAATLNLAGITFQNFGNSPVVGPNPCTLTSNIVVSGSFNSNGTINRTTSETITIHGGITAPNNSFQGTVELVAKGGTITTGAYTFSIDSNLTIDGNVTFAGNVLYYSGEYGVGRTLKYLSGTTNAASTTLYTRRPSSIDTSGISWGAFVRSMSSNSTTTLISNLNVLGATSILSSGPIDSSTSAKLITRGLTLSAAQSGTAAIELSGGTWSGNFAVSNPFIFNGTSTISGTVQYGGSLVTYTSGTITAVSSGNITLPNSTQTISFNVGSNMQVPVILAGGTKTLSSNFSTGGLITISGATTINRTTTETFSCGGGLAVNNTVAGTAVIELTGGTWSGTNTTGISNNLNINGNVTISGNVYYGTGTLGYLSGTVTGGTLNLVANCTINTSTLRWNNLTISSGTTYTLTSDLNINGLLSAAVGGGTRINRTTSEVVNCFGGFNIGNNFIGNATIVAKGGTLISNGFAAINGPNLTIDGDVTFSGNFTYGAGTMTYLSGNVITQNSLLATGNSTLNTNGIIWNNLQLNDYVTLSSNLIAIGRLTQANLVNLNRTTNETLTVYGGVTISNFYITGTANIILKGGSWIASNLSNNYITNPVTIDGNVTFGTNASVALGTLTYLSGTMSGSLNVLDNQNFVNFHKGAVSRVIITTGKTVTMNEFFTGTPTNPAVISASTALGQYTVTFTDSFEKIGKNVVVSGCVPSQPLQLVLPYTTRTSAIKTTNRGIRYTNQSPNSISKDSKINPQISPIGLLVSDPNFKVP